MLTHRRNTAAIPGRQATANAYWSLSGSLGSSTNRPVLVPTADTSATASETCRRGSTLACRMLPLAEEQSA